MVAAEIQSLPWLGEWWDPAGYDVQISSEQAGRFQIAHQWEQWSAHGTYDGYRLHAFFNRGTELLGMYNPARYLDNEFVAANIQWDNGIVWTRSIHNQGQAN